VLITRAFSLVAAAVPVLVGIAPLVRHLHWGRAVLTLLAGILFQAGTNIVNDLGDARRGVDRLGTPGPPNAVVAGLITPPGALVIAVACFAAGSLIGLWLAALAGWALLWLGVAGLLGGVGYTAGPQYKYLALGDVGVFLLMGPLMTLGTQFVQLGRYTWSGAWLGTGVGFLVAAVLVANNVRDIERDVAVGIRTTATILGRSRGGQFYAALVVAAFAALPLLAGTGQTSWWALGAYVSAPLALAQIRRALAPGAEPRTWARILRRTVMVHLAYGASLAAGLVTGAFA